MDRLSLKVNIFIIKKMHNHDEEKIECALGNMEFCFWQGKKAENDVFLLLTSGLAAFICL